MTPVLFGAQFSDTGTTILVTFDSDTNKGGLVGRWKCSILFEFPGIANEKCQWTSDSTALVYLTAESTVLPLQNITVLPGVVKASCTRADISKCDLWPYANYSSEPIQYPSTPLIPVPLIQGPAKIGSCDDIALSGAG